jgi:hypothetical protein
MYDGLLEPLSHYAVFNLCEACCPRDLKGAGRRCCFSGMWKYDPFLVDLSITQVRIGRGYDQAIISGLEEVMR